MYLRFKDLSGMGWAGGPAGGPLPGGVETKTLLVAPMTFSPPGGVASGASRDQLEEDDGYDGGGAIPGGSIPVKTPVPVAVLPPPGAATAQTGCQRYQDPRVNESARVKALNNASNYYQKMISNAQTATRAANLCQNPTTRNKIIEYAKDLQAQAKAGTEYFNRALNAKCAGDAEDAASALQGMMARSDSTYNLADGVARGGCTAPVDSSKKGGSMVAANLPGSTNYGQQSDVGYDYGDFLSTPLPSFDSPLPSFDNWGDSSNWGGGGYQDGPGFDQFTDLEPGGGDGLSLDYTSGGDQMPGDTFGAPEVEIPQDQGIDLNLPTGNEGGMIQGKKFPWWLLLVGGAVLAMSNDGKGKKKGKR